MGILIAVVLFGIGFAFLATQNTNVITLHAGIYTSTLPLFAVVLGSILLGLFVAWILSAIGKVSSSVTMHKKDSTIKQTQNAVGALESKIKELEIENSRLKGEKHVVAEEHHEKEVSVENKPGFLSRFQHSLQH